MQLAYKTGCVEHGCWNHTNLLLPLIADVTDLLFQRGSYTGFCFCLYRCSFSTFEGAWQVVGRFTLCSVLRIFLLMHLGSPTNVSLGTLLRIVAKVAQDSRQLQLLAWTRHARWGQQENDVQI